MDLHVMAKTSCLLVVLIAVLASDLPLLFFAHLTEKYTGITRTNTSQVIEKFQPLLEHSAILARELSLFGPVTK
jgi:hypothetical protein